MFDKIDKQLRGPVWISGSIREETRSSLAVAVTGMLALLFCLISFTRKVLALLHTSHVDRPDYNINMGEPYGKDTVDRVKNITAKQDPDDDEIVDELPPSTPIRRKSARRRVSDVIDSIGNRDVILPGHSTPRQRRPNHLDLESPDQGYSATPDTGVELPTSVVTLFPEWMTRRTDCMDATPPTNAGGEEQMIQGTPSGLVAMMPTTMESNRYNMSHKNRGKCLVFNHEVFDTGFDNREGSSVDAKRIESTFRDLGFSVEVHDNLEHSNVIAEITKLSEEDHTNNDCVCIFVLTHGLNNDLICAKDVAYKSDRIWKAFTADKCPTLAGKPKLFFFQACRGDKLDSGITLLSRAGNTQTDSGTSSYKIPTHSDFLIAHSSVEGFFSWRNPEEGTWYVQCLCDTLKEYAASTDLLKMLTITARRVATEHQSYNDINPAKHEQKQVPSTTSMLIRDLYFDPK